MRVIKGMNPKVSVIIPIYNVERYIERCVVSLMSQTLEEIEFIFVNDSTPDNSMSILKNVIAKYPERLGNIIILEHEDNQGLASARNTGLRCATGDFVIHCDSDDWVEVDMYEKMYNLALSDDADIVVCDVIHDYEDHESIEKLNPKMPARDVINKLNIRYGWYLCNKLVKRSLIIENEIFPLIGMNMWEDLAVTNRMFYYAETVSYIDIPLYHYNRHNETSIVTSTAMLGKRRQQYQVIEFLNSFFKQNKFDFSEGYLAYRIALKDKFLELTPSDYKSWREFYPEIADYVLKDKQYSFLYRLFYYIAQKGFILPFVIIRKISDFFHA